MRNNKNIKIIIYMKKNSEIMMIVFCPYIVIYRQKRQIRLLKSDMNYASKLWSIERDPRNVDYNWIVRNAFHVKPIFSRYDAPHNLKKRHT